jgi:hypothetical protein
MSKKTERNPFDDVLKRMLATKPAPLKAALEKPKKRGNIRRQVAVSKPERRR